MHVSEPVSHVWPEAHAQLDWPVSVLVVSYVEVTGHVRQLVSPAIEEVCAPQAVHEVSAVGVHNG